MRVPLTPRQRFWLAILRLAFRRLRLASPVVPDGVPTIRDASLPCPAYEPRRREPGDWGDCETDGHYLCRECVHISAEAAERRR